MTADDLARRGRGTSDFHLYFEVDRGSSQLSIETSWLPDRSEVNDALLPLGFRRREPDGAYRVTLPDVDERSEVSRHVTKALTILVAFHEEQESVPVTHQLGLYDLKWRAKYHADHC